MQTASILPLRRTSGSQFISPHLPLCTARTLIGPLIGHDITPREITCSGLNTEWHTELKVIAAVLFPAPFQRGQQSRADYKLDPVALLVLMIDKEF